MSDKDELSDLEDLVGTIQDSADEIRRRLLIASTKDDEAANRYHQRLGAKWMVEAIVKEIRTTYRLHLNKSAQEFANHLEHKWEDESFWRPSKP